MTPAAREHGVKLVVRSVEGAPFCTLNELFELLTHRDYAPLDAKEIIEEVLNHPDWYGIEAEVLNSNAKN